MLPKEARVPEHGHAVPPSTADRPFRARYAAIKCRAKAAKGKAIKALEVAFKMAEQRMAKSPVGPFRAAAAKARRMVKLKQSRDDESAKTKTAKTSVASNRAGAAATVRSVARREENREDTAEENDMSVGEGAVSEADRAMMLSLERYLKANNDDVRTRNASARVSSTGSHAGASWKAGQRARAQETEKPVHELKAARTSKKRKIYQAVLKKSKNLAGALVAKGVVEVAASVMMDVLEVVIPFMPIFTMYRVGRRIRRGEHQPWDPALLLFASGRLVFLGGV